MCGITGLFTIMDDQRDDWEMLYRMRNALRHRGPDDAGVFISGPIGLAHRRLSIIDLDTGHQPLGNEDGSIQIVYNGEVYNFQELHHKAEMAGHHFRTRTDTEVIVHLYEDRAERVLNDLNGMFAFALWDGPRRKLFLARDRIGVKPLYYAGGPGRFAFASEIPPLLQLPWVSREIDPLALDAYLRHGYVSAPHTIFRDVRKLPSAHFMVVTETALHVERYWSPANHSAGKYDEYALQEQLLEELDRSVRMQLVSDVPLGAFLSGGIDSSSVVALMRRHCTGTLKTFSVGIDGGREFNELRYARDVSRFLSTEHHELILQAGDLVKLLEESTRFLDEPVADAATIPTYLVAKLASESVKVVLTGEGADETWAGYDTFRNARLVQKYRRLPVWIRRPLSDPLFKRLPAASKLVAASYRPDYLGQGPLVNEPLRQALYTRDALLELSQQETIGYNDGAHALDPKDPVHSVSCALLETSLPERLLCKVDRMTMAHSIEARVPFLDTYLTEFALTVPGALKLRGGTTKYLLRRALRGLLPPAILKRKKHGFDLPCTTWLRTAMAPLVQELFSNPMLAGWLDGAAMRQLYSRHMEGEDWGVQIWALMTLELWARSHA